MDTVERVAIAIWKATADATFRPQDYPLWSNMTEDQKMLVRVAAKAAIKALAQTDPALHVEGE